MIVFDYKKITISLTVLCLATSSLTGCATQNDANLETTVTSPSPENAILYGETREKLNVIEKLYKQTPQDPLIAARYGKALRESGQLKAAKSILLPLANNSNVETMVNTELSALYFTQADFEKAESAARKAINADKNNYRAWRNLGASLDAQEDYKKGEEAFRKSLDMWGGEDKVPVMNNLALNLAAQGYTDEALSLLYDAQKLSPNRIEIERNIRIIRTLNEPPEYKGTKVPTPDNQPPKE